MFKVNAKFDADSLLYSLSHFECMGHRVHMLTQGHLPPPLTSTVKSSLFMQVHSSPLSLAASLRAITQSILSILTMTGLLPDDFILSLIHYFITHLYYNYKPTFEYPCIYIHGN